MKKKSVKNGYAFSKMTARQRIWRDRHSFLMLLPALAVTIVFAYIPMFGLIMAFQDFNIFKGVWGSEWVGLENFIKIFSQKQFLGAIGNTLLVSALNLLLCFPAPIILALLINELRTGVFKKTVQTISYLPHFLSWISIVGFVHLLFGRDGFVNDLLVSFGATERPIYLADQKLFIWFIIGSMFWKETGWGTVIHLANLSSISPELYEAASIDGATRMQKIRYITLPHMFPTVMILLIFQMGAVFNSNFELIYGLQNPYIDFEVINTIIYQTGINSGNYSMATALGFAQGLVALVLVFGTNWISKKLTDNSIL
ncbi:MAG: sugar ABC transporter permease [Lachnospiraceae bacterium]|nr:sugar ABC transporter permease [Lachnospiraceae bacterium]